MHYSYVRMPTHTYVYAAWLSGQDQMRILKTQLTTMLPSVRIFLECVPWRVMHLET